jgi:hypothetical protein
MSGCKPCAHHGLDQINQQLIAGTPFLAISEHFGLSVGALHRHKENHLKKEIADAIQSREGERAERASTLLDCVQKLVGEAEELLAKAKAKENIRDAATVINSTVKVLELLGRLTGQLSNAGAGISLNFTSNRTTTINNNVNVGDDKELAQMVGEATGNFNPAEIERLKALASGTATHSRTLELPAPRVAGA